MVRKIQKVFFMVVILGVLYICLFVTKAKAETYFFNDWNWFSYTIVDGGKGVSIDSWSASESFTIPASVNGIKVTRIGNSAFSSSSIQHITIPASVTTIGEFAFDNCRYLKSITIPSNVTSIGKYAFCGCESLQSVTIPGSVRTIGEYAFYNCKSLKSVTIPSNVTSIGNSAFYGCESLQSVTIPGNVKKIGTYAFAYCSGLQSVFISNGITEICDDLFYNCRSLEYVELPDSLSHLCFCAFGNCAKLKEVYVPDTVRAFTDLSTGYEYTPTNSNIVILGNNNSAAKNYATRHGYRFEVFNCNRLCGDSRFDTSIEAAEELKSVLGVSKFDNIVVASGEAFPDALAGSYLANVKNAPMLLTACNNASVQRTTATYIKENLKPGGTVYILGGTGAISSSFESQLYGINVIRLAGANRYETNLLVLSEVGIAPGSDILVCRGDDFADSLSASAVGKPIFLVSGKLFGSQLSWLDAIGSNNTFYLIGGTGAVSNLVSNSLQAYGYTERICGMNRFETSVAIASRFFNNPTKLVLAYSQTAWDGLSSGPLASKLGLPLLLAQNSTKAIDIIKEYVCLRRLNLNKIYIMGGNTLVANCYAASILLASHA
ncbi:MAG: leucine-rich repeat protein [Lachnospiraceae bacterium]|nr:leucine-rich repeat protein [Lachnospiraceae bacterium]